MKLISNYIINTIIVILLLILFNIFVHYLYTSYMDNLNSNTTFDTYSVDICRNKYYEENISNPIITNEDVYGDETIGYIAFPTLGSDVKAPLTQGNDIDQDSAMLYGVSHDPDTPMPGESGNVVIAGHRHQLFSNLQYLNEGDLIVINVYNNIFLYEVTSSDIVNPSGTTEEYENAVDVIFGNDGESELTLYTCYPFERYKKYPYRYVVHAKPIKASEVECIGGGING